LSDCLAALERFSPGETEASKIGVSSGCVFCSGRRQDAPAIGDQLLLLHGARAGTLVKVTEAPSQDGRFQFEEWGDINQRPQTGLRSDLFVKLPIEQLGRWLPPFGMRDAFVIDELAVWFCDGSFIGRTFHWNAEKIITVAEVCMNKRLAIEPVEMCKVMLAHGLPYDRQDEFIDKLGLLFAAFDGRNPRKRVKSRRNEEAIWNAVANAMRYWGR
jgi:hypothetical protein